MKTLHCLELVYSKNYLNLTKKAIQDGGKLN